MSDFLKTFCPKIYVRKYLKQFNTLKTDITYTTDTSRPKSVYFCCKQYIIWEYPDIYRKKYAKILDLIQKSLWILSIFLSDFLGQDFLGQKPDQNVSQGEKCCTAPNLHTTKLISETEKIIHFENFIK